MPKLKLSDWSNISDIVASIVVVFSLVYVGLELNQNTMAVRANSFEHTMEMHSGSMNLLAADEALHRIIMDGDKFPKGLSKEKWSRYKYFQYPRFGAWEYAYLGYIDGTIGES